MTKKALKDPTFNHGLHLPVFTQEQRHDIATKSKVIFIGVEGHRNICTVLQSRVFVANTGGSEFVLLSTSKPLSLVQ